MSPICSATKPAFGVVLARLQSRHDSDSNGVDAKNVARTSLVSKLVAGEFKVIKSRQLDIKENEIIV